MKRTLSFVLALILCLSLAAVPQMTGLAASGKAPAKIIGLKITTAGKSKQLKLTWNQQSGVSGYQIYRSTTGKTGSYQKIATLRGAAKTGYTDTGLKTSKTYFYAVRAFGKVNGKIVYGKFTKANLSTRLTKATLQKKLVAANKFYIGWISNCYDAYKCEDENDRKPIPGENSDDGLYYIRINSKEFKSVADLKKAAAKHFIKAIYEDEINRIYADIDGKLYMKTYDGGGDGGEGKGTLKVLSLTDTACRFRVIDRYDFNADYDSAYTYKLVYKNGRWLFKNMTNDFNIFCQGNNFWA